jgi:hypothetical protein
MRFESWTTSSPSTSTGTRETNRAPDPTSRFAGKRRGQRAPRRTRVAVLGRAHRAGGVTGDPRRLPGNAHPRHRPLEVERAVAGGGDVRLGPSEARPPDDPGLAQRPFAPRRLAGPERRDRRLRHEPRAGGDIPRGGEALGDLQRAGGHSPPVPRRGVVERVRELRPRQLPRERGEAAFRFVPFRGAERCAWAGRLPWLIVAYAEVRLLR